METLSPEQRVAAVVDRIKKIAGVTHVSYENETLSVRMTAERFEAIVEEHLAGMQELQPRGASVLKTKPGEEHGDRVVRFGLHF